MQTPDVVVVGNAVVVVLLDPVPEPLEILYTESTPLFALPGFNVLFK